MSKARVILLINYARSGGTLLARCLEALPHTLVFSEVHPIYVQGKTLAEQAKFHGISIKSSSYKDQMFELIDCCNKLEKTLIIRDWTFIDFTPHDINDFSPSYQFLNYKLLSEMADLKVFAFVRDAIDIWISRWRPEHFFMSYSNYAEQLIEGKIPIFKYEDFCSDPSEELKRICDFCDLEFGESYQKFYENEHIQGDQANWKWSSERDHKLISLTKRKYIPESARCRLQGDVKMKEVQDKMNYSSDYFSRTIAPESIITRVKLELLDRLRSANIIQAKERY